MRVRSFRQAVVSGFILCSMTAAQPSQKLQGMLRRIFDSREFGGAGRGGRGAGGARWMEDGQAYTAIEPAASGGGASEIVRYDPATGKHEILLSAAQLTPRETRKPLAIDDY